MLDYNVYKYLVYTPSYDGKKSIITLQDIPNLDGGFISTYIYDKSLKEYYEINGKVKGYAKTNPIVASNVLFVDFDNNEDAARKFYKRLKKYGIGFKVFDSGGRSIHFHVKREYVEPSPTLLRNDKTWVSHNIEGADTCLYECSRVFRLPGTVHHETGKKKTLIDESKGRSIKIPNTFVLPEKQPIQSKKNGLFGEPYIKGVMDGFTNGSRNNEAYALIQFMQEYGCDSNFISTFVELCNEQSIEPMDVDELDTLFRKHL